MREPGVASDLYVAVRWPENHVVFRLTMDDPDAYDAIRLRVNESVREALDAMGVAFTCKPDIFAATYEAVE